MDDTMRVQATLAGIDPERFEALTRLEITSEHFSLFERFDADALIALMLYELEPEELVTLVGNKGYNPNAINVYAKLRKHGIAESEIEGSENPTQLLQGLEAGISLPRVRRAIDARLPMHDLIRGLRAKISFEDLFQVNAARKHSIGDYIKGRTEWGYSHDELITVLREIKVPYQDFEISQYHKVRSAGITHIQVLQMLQDERVDHHSRGYYVDYVTVQPNPLSHDEAYELAVNGIYPSSYWAVRRGATHEEFKDVLKLGVTAKALEDYGKFRQNNCRVTHQEVLQYLQLSEYIDGINEYIKLIDAGYRFDEILEAHNAGITFWQFKRLRRSPISVTQQEILELAALDGFVFASYIKLREEGIAHATIVEGMQSLQSA